MIPFRLVDSGWETELNRAVRADLSGTRIICPFIKLAAAERLVRRGRPHSLQVITRFDLNGFYSGVSDIAALRLLFQNGARIRGVRHLHAKLYLFGESRAIVTSANLTEAALLKNQEFGFVAEDPEIVARCRRYFESLWKRAGRDLREERLDEWERRIEHRILTGGPATPQNELEDEGVDVGLPEEPVASAGWPAEASQAFVKLFGEGTNRAERSTSVLTEVERSGCHWACSYPRGKRPRQVNDGALMFMGRMVKRPDDVLIYGRAVGLRHQPRRDDASEEDLLRRLWKENWPHYIRVHHAEFVAGELENGISLNDLMASLGSDSFLSTQRNAAAGEGNINPRLALMQQAAAALTPEALTWLNERLEYAFEYYGKLPPEDLAGLDWPALS